jgi:putative dehydrogenase
MTKTTVAVIAQGAMGAGIGGLLAANGVDVVTSLDGRGAASAERARKAGMRAVSPDGIAAADIILSIVPPRDAMALAERLGPSMAVAARKPLYIDCNAVSSAQAVRIGAVVGATGASYADGGIIGPPPRPGYCPWLYVSGVEEARIAPLREAGVRVRVVEGGIGAASALKMAYASCTKGLTALGAAAVLVAERHGATAALRRELSESQPGVLAFLDRSVPDMFTKAYRFVGEMEQIAEHSERRSIADIYRGIAALFDELARDQEGEKREIAVLDRFTKSGG